MRSLGFDRYVYNKARPTRRNGTPRIALRIMEAGCGIVVFRCISVAATSGRRDNIGAPLSTGVTHREYQVEEEQQVLHASHAAGHHFRHSHLYVPSFVSLKRRRASAGVWFFVVTRAEAERSADSYLSVLFRLYVSPFSPSLGTSTTRVSRDLLARQLFAVKCAGRCIFVVARWTRAMRAQSSKRKVQGRICAFVKRVTSLWVWPV